MALSIRVPNANFSKNIGQLYPFPENAKLISFFGGSEEETLVNKVVGSEQLSTVVGSPTYASNYVEVSDETKYIDTNLTVEGKFTFIAVVNDMPSACRVMGTYTDSPSANTEYLGSNADLVRFDVEGNNGALNSPITGWRFIAGSVASDEHAVYAYNGDSQAASQYVRDLSVTAGGSIRVGGYSTNTSNLQIAAVAYYDRGLSSVEIEETYKWMKERVLARGINLS